MAGDLEKFLQQAAERLAEKVNEAAGGPRPAPQKQQPPRQPTPPRQPPRNVRRAERAPVEPDIIEPEIVDADLVDQALSGSDPLSTIDTRHLDPAVSHRPQLGGRINQADERMSAHVKHVTDHDVVGLRTASTAVDSNLESDKRTGIERKSVAQNPLIEMLRNPDSLRAAFIAGEIFRRPE
ncbi:MAG: hypothetical protein ACE361_11945 [Aureliella sp.]